MVRQIALDTETTGMNKARGGNRTVTVGHRIIEIGCVEIIDRVITGRSFHTLVNPGRKIDPKATAVHGITDAHVKNSPRFADIVDQLLDFINGDEVIIHNAPFDTAFLDKEFRILPNHKQPSINFSCIDTLVIARAIFPGEDNTLNALCQRFNVANAVEHSALLDAVMLAHVYLKLTDLLR